MTIVQTMPDAIRRNTDRRRVNDSSGSCPRASATSRVARLRNSFGYFLDAGMASIGPMIVRDQTAESS
jgi:hypothetical protein